MGAGVFRCERLNLAITLKTGIATAHGTNLVDIRGEYSDETTAMWQTVLSTRPGEAVHQSSSEKYQKRWQHNNPTPCVFHLTEETNWKTLSDKAVETKGRLLGGCIDIIRHLIGTPFGDVAYFQKQFIVNEPIIWYLENCGLSSTDLRRTLVHMKLAGWFNNCAGLMFGRSPEVQEVDGYTIVDVYQDMAEDLGLPIIYDIDCGHMPPQITFVNGAYAEVSAANGRGIIVQHFK